VETENPVPLTVTETPEGPCVGLIMIAGTVAVNVAEAVSAETVPTSLPLATTGWAPLEDGTVKVHENVPVADVVCEVQVWVVGVEPP
jgi:DNA-directed RNA polymerase beta subunit